LRFIRSFSSFRRARDRRGRRTASIRRSSSGSRPRRAIRRTTSRTSGWTGDGRAASRLSATKLDFWSHPEVELDLAAGTGVQVYRLGVDWGRVEPRPHEFDAKAIARYRRLLGLVKARHMRVMLTLMHHSVPKWAQESGGWLQDGMKDDYEEFARRMIDEFAPEVDFWITFNEANVFAPLAYANGLWPPGGRLSLASFAALGPLRGAVVRAEDRMSDAHNELYDWAHRAHPGIKLGIAHNMAFYTGKTAFGRLAAWPAGALMNWRFPERIRGHTDFFGMNYYGAEWIKDGRLELDPEEEYSEAGRAVYPQGLRALLKEVHRRFPDQPIIITENGVADSTDLLRPAYLLEHLAAVARARAEGVPVVGYFFWTLSDNMEWSDGYCPKFGLVAVDRARDLRRTPRSSYFLFKRIVATRAVTPEMRRDAWDALAASAGKPRPFCRAADAVTALDAPAERPFASKDWRFR
jgi:beta-glucosidase/6-phospho-beta-glucosidase/beta-galactosidase